jgi:biotin carboxylase
VTGCVAVIGTNKAQQLAGFLNGREDVVVFTEPWYAAQYEAAGARHIRVIDSVENVDALRRGLGEILREQPVSAIIGPAERTVQPAAYLRSYFGLPGTPFDVAVGFTVKHLMKRRLNAAGVPTARYEAVATLGAVPDAASRLGYPAVVKRAMGAGATNTFVLRTVADAEALVHNPPPALDRSGVMLVVEEYLAVTEEYHSEALVSDGCLRLAGVARYFEPLLRRHPDTAVGSSYLPATDPAHRRVIALHRMAVRALGLKDGVTHLEVLRTGDEQWVVGEIAARPAGGAIPQAFQATFGIDLWRYFLACEGDPSLASCHDQAAASPAARRAGWVGLPIAPGVVRRISGVEDLVAATGVLCAQVLLKPGDVITPRFHSASMSAYAIFQRRPDVPEADQVASIVSRFHLEIT